MLPSQKKPMLFSFVVICCCRFPISFSNFESPRKMSLMSPLFTIIGDSNVRRNMTGLNVASREAMKSAQIIDCDKIASLESALRDVRAESNVLIIASITEFLMEPGDCGTIFSSIDPVLAALTTKLSGFCAYRPSLQVGVTRLTPSSACFICVWSLTSSIIEKITY